MSSTTTSYIYCPLVHLHVASHVDDRDEVVDRLLHSKASPVSALFLCPTGQRRSKEGKAASSHGFFQFYPIPGANSIFIK